MRLVALALALVLAGATSGQQVCPHCGRVVQPIALPRPKAAVAEEDDPPPPPPVNPDGRKVAEFREQVNPPHPLDTRRMTAAEAQKLPRLVSIPEAGKEQARTGRPILFWIDARPGDSRPLAELFTDVGFAAIHVAATNADVPPEGRKLPPRVGFWTPDNFRFVTADKVTADTADRIRGAWLIPGGTKATVPTAEAERGAARGAGRAPAGSAGGSSAAATAARSYYAPPPQRTGYRPPPADYGVGVARGLRPLGRPG